MKFKKESVKPFILGCVTTLVVIGIIIGLILLINSNTGTGKSNSKNKIVDGVTYVIDHEEKIERVCDAFKDIMIDGHDYFITNDGTLYIVSDKKFSSNNQNCIVSNSNVKFKSRINYKLISIDNKIYEVYDDGEKIEVSLSNNPGDFTKSLINDDYIDVSDCNSIYDRNTDTDVNTCIVLKKDRNIYRMTFKGKYNNSKYKYVYSLQNEELIKSFDNEKVIKYNLTNEPNSGYILTNKHAYLQQVTNKECLEYQDIKCNFEYKLNKYLDRYIGNILYLNYYDNQINLTTIDGTIMYISMKSSN